MKRRRWILISMAALLIAYPLSLGPVFKIQVLRKQPLVRFVHTGQLWFPGFYAPLQWLGFEVPFIGKAMDRYLDLWVGDYPLEETIFV